jgi:hypothetical protein
MARIIHGGRTVAFYTYTDGTTPSVGLTAVFTGADQISTDVAKDDTGLATITIEQIQDDETFATFIRTYAPQSEGGGIEDILFEDGTQLLGAASGTKLVAVVKGGVAVGGDKTKVFACVGSLSKASGSWSQSGNTYNRPSLVFTAAAIETDVTLTTVLFSGIMTTATEKVLDSDLDKYGAVYYA